MKRTDIFWKSGTIDYWDFDEIVEGQPLTSQIDYLKEDMAQISFQDGMLLDIGWYPSFDPGGEFVISTIQNGDWEAPAFRAVAKDLQSLREQICIAISKIE